MKYITLIHAGEGMWDELSDDERRAIYDRYLAVADEMRAAGVILGGSELEPTRHATTVRVRDGETLVTDGPYAEVKEALGGYFLLECESMDEAIEWAARIPGAEHGAIEVRPLHVEPAGVA
jgi:hypothetical protein